MKTRPFWAAVAALSKIFNDCGRKKISCNLLVTRMTIRFRWRQGTLTKRIGVHFHSFHFSWCEDDATITNASSDR